MKNVLELLERTAARLPRQTAFADQQCSYDYQTVVNIAGSVGSALAANGDRNCPVAVLMERGAPCLVTLMGVHWKRNPTTCRLCLGGTFLSVKRLNYRQR